MFYSQHFTFHWKLLVYFLARATRMLPRDFAFWAKSLRGQLLVINSHQLIDLEGDSCSCGNYQISAIKMKRDFCK